MQNGGGFAKCDDGKLYQYDYLLSRATPFQNRHASSTREDLEFIIKELRRLKDPLASHLENFVTSIGTQKSGNLYQWFERTPMVLQYLPDLDENLPPNCHKRFQAAGHYSINDQQPYVSYTFDPALIKKVENQVGDPLQISYLWIHEWLWNFFDWRDLQTSADFNHLLHSKQLETLSPEDYKLLRPDPRSDLE